jgi:acyl carrier protein
LPGVNVVTPDRPTQPANTMNNYLTEKDTRIVQDILTRELGVKPEQLMGEARLQADLGADSLTLIQITMAIEERFNATLPDERLEQVRTVDELCAALAEVLYPEVHPN